MDLSLFYSTYSMGVPNILDGPGVFDGKLITTPPFSLRFTVWGSGSNEPR
jgi:hypothetical protein